MLTAIAVLALLSLYNLLSMRAAVRQPAQNQPGDLLRITTDTVRQEAARQDTLRQEMRQEMRQDMARQVTQVERDLVALQRRVDGEIERVEVMQARPKLEVPPAPAAPPVVQASSPPPVAAAAPAAASTPAPALAAVVTPPAPKVTAADAMAVTIRSAIDANRVDLYLQPMVTLPQRK